MKQSECHLSMIFVSLILSLLFFVAMFSFVITNKRLNSLCYNKLQIATCEANQNIEPTYKLGKLNI